MSGDLPPRTGSGAPYATPNEAYQAADGYILIAAYQDAHWQTFCELIGRPDLADAPAYREPTERLKNRKQLSDEIEAALSSQPASHWLELFDRHGLSCAPVADYAMVAGFDQLAHIGAIVHCDHATAGTVTMPGFSIGGPSMPIRRSPPRLGEDDDLVEWPDAG